MPVLRFHCFRSDVVTLILIFRLHLLSYAIELVQVPLPVLLLLLFFVHAITSGIVCTVSRNNSLCHLFIFKIIPNKKKTHIAIEMIIAILVPINTYRIAQFHIFTNIRTNANTIATKRSRPAICLNNIPNYDNIQQISAVLALCGGKNIIEHLFCIFNMEITTKSHRKTPHTFVQGVFHLWFVGGKQAVQHSTFRLL